MGMSYFGFEEVGILRIIIVFVLWILIIWFLVRTIVGLVKTKRTESLKGLKKSLRRKEM